MMSPTSIIIVDILDVWGIDLMGPFSNSSRNEYILLCVDFVSKLVEVIPTRMNESKVVVRFLQENIFARYVIARPSLMIKGPISIIGPLMHSLRGTQSSLKWQPYTTYKLMVK